MLSPVVPVPGFKATILLHKSGEKGLLVMEGLPATEGLDYSLTVTDTVKPALRRSAVSVLAAA